MNRKALLTTLVVLSFAVAGGCSSGDSSSSSGASSTVVSEHANLDKPTITVRHGKVGVVHLENPNDSHASHPGTDLGAWGSDEVIYVIPSDGRYRFCLSDDGNDHHLLDLYYTSTKKVLHLVAGQNSCQDVVLGKGRYRMVLSYDPHAAGGKGETVFIHASSDDASTVLVTVNECERCNLTGAQLKGADLSGAALNGSVLRDANLEGANLRGAQLGTVVGTSAKDVVGE